MSEKHDRSYARTAQDIERKYSFGKTFADMLGLINENRDHVDSVESGLKNEIAKTETALSRTDEEIKAVAKKTGELSSAVEMKLSAEAFSLAIEKELANGVDKVVTKTGYEFGADGMHISKTGDEMENTVDHTGMYVKRGDEDILTANNKGVDATNLHAKTYLIIGEGDGSSRFEDYNLNGERRTGCFWVGG